MQNQLVTQIPDAAARYESGVDPMELPTERELFARFQSLGDNCEFGIIQRLSGIEPLDLLRFAGFRDEAPKLLFRLTDALKRDFEGLGNPENIRCELHGEQDKNEYVVYETKWQLQYHSGCSDSEISEEALRKRQVELLRFKRRELFADLRDAKTIFVWKSNAQVSAAAVRDLVAELRRRGPNLLLWVKECDAAHPAGSVAFVGDGLLVGHITKFAPYAAATNVDYAAWCLLCRNTSALANRLRAQRA